MRFRPHTLMITVVGVADDGETLRPIELKAAAIAVGDLGQWVVTGLDELIALADAELAADAPGPEPEPDG